MCKELWLFTIIPENANSTKNPVMEWEKFGTESQKAGKVFRHSIGNTSGTILTDM